jgi:hypothetical protein
MHWRPLAQGEFLGIPRDYYGQGVVVNSEMVGPQKVYVALLRTSSRRRIVGTAVGLSMQTSPGILGHLLRDRLIASTSPSTT